jgi:glycosyltransferase involved in cell wall biosynthesis
VDDGSTDRTTSIAKSHAVVDYRVILISQENAGVAAARNAGWQRALSDLIAFVDADDLWAPTKIERQLELILAGGQQIGLVYTRFAVIDEQNRIRYKVGRDVDGDVFKHTLMQNVVGHGSSPLIRREALVAVGGFDPGLRRAGAQGCEDWQLYQRIAARYHFGLVPEYLTGYRVTSRTMSTDRPRMLRSLRMVADEIKRSHPNLSDEADEGIRSYLQFLVSEAIASRDLGQFWSLMSSWIPAHPSDCVVIPLAVFCSKVRRHVQWLGWILSGQENAVFPIGEPEL